MSKPMMNVTKTEKIILVIPPWKQISVEIFGRSAIVETNTTDESIGAENSERRKENFRHLKE